MSAAGHFNTMTELYNALVNGSNTDANFVCSALEEHAKNIPLRNDAVIEFYEFALQFFDRIFGEDTTGRSENDLPKDWNMLRCGGWLRSVSCSSYSAMSHMTSQASKSLHSSSSFIDHKPMTGMSQTGYQLSSILFSHSNVMDILKRNSGNFNLDYTLLPSKLAIILSRSEEATDIMTYMYTYNLRKLQLIASSYNSFPQLPLPPFHYFLILLARYPTCSDEIFSENFGNIKRNHQLKPNLGVVQLLQSNVYFSVLRHYLSILLPRYKSSQDYAIELSQEGELFLRFCLEYWLNITPIIRINYTQFMKKYLLVTNDYRTMSSPGATNTSLSAASSALRMMSPSSRGFPPEGVSSILTYSPLTVHLLDRQMTTSGSPSINLPVYTTPAMQCTYLLLMHILSDIRISTTSENVACGNLEELLAFATERSYDIATMDSLPCLQHIYSFIYHESSKATMMGKDTLLACPLSLHMVQQPLFDMLRTIFSNGSHANYCSLKFHEAVQIWLLYIQPWSSSTAGNVPKSFVYSSEWDYYISTNLHFYTTLLGIFLHTVSSVSIHPSDPDGLHFLNSLEKVLLCFSGKLLKTVQNIVYQFNSWHEYEVIDFLMTNQNKYKNNEIAMESIFKVKKPMVDESLSMHRLAILIHHYHVFPDFSETCLFSQPAVDLLSNILLTPAQQQGSNNTHKTTENQMKIDSLHHILNPMIEINYIYSSKFMSSSSSSIINIRDDCKKILNSLSKMVKINQESWALQIWEQIYETFNGPVQSNYEKQGYSHLMIDHAILLIKQLIIPSVNNTTTTTTAVQSSDENDATNNILTVETSPRFQNIDSLDAPIASYEWSPMVVFTVTLSQQLNSIFQLPKDDIYIYKNYKEILYQLWNEFKSNPTNIHCFKILLNSFRINLRGLSNITLLVCILMISILYTCYKLIRGDFHFFTIITTSIVLAFIIKGIQMISNFYYQHQKTNANQFKIRDEYTGKLTDYGRQLVITGYETCKKDDLKFTGDGLKRPFCSYEIRILAEWLIQLSVWLNQRYHLPIETDCVSWTWEFILLKAWNNRHIMNPIYQIFYCGRFNLRYLSRYYVWLRLLVVLFVLWLTKPVLVKVFIGCVCIVPVAVIGGLESQLKRQKGSPQQQTDNQPVSQSANMIINNKQ